jgi:hypothetical protein
MILTKMVMQQSERLFKEADWHQLLHLHGSSDSSVYLSIASQRTEMSS